MVERPGERQSDDHAHWSFGHLLAWHLERGTRPGGTPGRPGRQWGKKEFADATGVADRTVRFWLRSEHLPPEVETIERLLFGNDACFAEWRLELRRAHAASGRGKGDEEAQGALPIKDLPVSNIPIRVPEHFLGRDDALAEVETSLARYEGRVAITAVHGLRGVGKTTLAAAYADRHRSDYRAQWWIRAQTEPTMRADLAALGVRFGWAGGDDKEEPALDKVMERLRHEGEGILLIYDNASDASALKPYLPSGGAAKILVTSNAHTWRGVAAPVEIRLWPKQIGADYLIARTGRAEERAYAEALSDALGGLPLAHEQAAAYCERLAMPLAEYHSRFTASPARFLDDQRHAPAEHNDGMTVAKSFALAIDEASKLHPAAEPLIVHAALLAPEPVPLYFFAEAREKFGEMLASALEGDGLDEAVAALRAFALIDRDKIEDEREPSIAADCVRLHRLVRQVAAARREGEARETMLRSLLEAMAAVYPDGVYDDPKTWPRARRLDALALALVDAESPKGTEEKSAYLLDRLGTYRHKALAAYAQARLLFERALAICEKVFGPEHPETGAGLTSLALLLHSQSRLAEARPFFERALAIAEKALGPEHPCTTSALNNLALLLDAEGDLAASRSLHERALAIREKVLGPEHRLTAISLDNLAAVLADQGDLTGARLLHMRALAIFEKLLGPDHPDVAASLNNLAFVLKSQDDYAGARPLLERALTIKEKVLGAEHPDTARSLNNLASLLRDTGATTDAEPLFQRASAIGEKALGPNHPLTHRFRSGYARLLLETGRPAAALTYAEAALAVHVAATGPNHSWTKDSAAVAADALKALGSAEEAAALRARHGLEHTAPPSA